MGRNARQRRNKKGYARVPRHRRLLIPRWRYVVAYTTLLGIRAVVGAGVFWALYYVTSWTFKR